ncbi:MAG: M48 family metallopeptidase [Lewinellaceae bacterium]|nr:M48 family metallopeptidase [Lewinellaceae bacterium]
MPTSKNKFRAYIEVKGKEVPVDVVMERRHNTRFSITRRSVTLRLPALQAPSFVQQQLSALETWVTQQVEKKPALLQYFEKKRYQSGDILRVGDRKYWLEIILENRATHTAKLIGDTICLNLSENSSEEHRYKSIKTLLSRVVAGDFLPEITDRVYAINKRSFNRPITNVVLKYNHSNWGSCSAKGNVNLSTRLLFAPPDVQDYVILHELAHLVEMNHSDRFWALVASFMPDYEEKERWLKANGSTCDF